MTTKHCRHSLYGFMSKKAWLFWLMYFLPHKIRNLNLLTKIVGIESRTLKVCCYWVIGNILFGMFCYVTKHLNIQHISFLINENNKNRFFQQVLLALLIGFFFRKARKFPLVLLVWYDIYKDYRGVFWAQSGI